MYIHISTYIHIQAYLYADIYIYNKCIYMYTHTHIQMYECIYAFPEVHVYVLVFMCVQFKKLVVALLNWCCLTSLEAN